MIDLATHDKPENARPASPSFRARRRLIGTTSIVNEEGFFVQQETSFTKSLYKEKWLLPPALTLKTLQSSHTVYVFRIILGTSSESEPS